MSRNFRRPLPPVPFHWSQHAVPFSATTLTRGNPNFFSIYSDRRMVVLLGIGFASGLPSAYRLLGDSLSAWLGAYQVDIKTIGLFSLVGLPFALNFLWAPLLDRYAPPVLGRRRGWMLIIQILLVLAITGLALAGPTQQGE